MFNILVAVMTLILLVFVVVWWLRPSLRAQLEAPKYRFLAQERRFAKKTSGAGKPGEEREP